jgi:hypothetical protein
METQKELAQAWWNSLWYDEKDEFTVKHYYGKHPASLTENEIEKIWISEINSLSLS